LLLLVGIVIITALPGRQRRLDSSIIEHNTEQKNMTATRHTRHDMRTLNAHPTASPLRSQGLTAGIFA
jgi:hypothetical protein